MAADLIIASKHAIPRPELAEGFQATCGACRNEFGGAADAQHRLDEGGDTTDDALWHTTHEHHARGGWFLS